MSSRSYTVYAIVQMISSDVCNDLVKCLNISLSTLKGYLNLAICP